MSSAMEDDDTLAVALLILCKKRRKSRIKDWLLKRKSYSHINLLSELNFAPKDWHNYLRMDEVTYLHLLTLVTPLKSSRDIFRRARNASAYSKLLERTERLLRLQSTRYDKTVQTRSTTIYRIDFCNCLRSFAPIKKICANFRIHVRFNCTNGLRSQIATINRCHDCVPAFTYRLYLNTYLAFSVQKLALRVVHIFVGSIEMFIYLFLFIVFTLICFYLRYVNSQLNNLIPTIPNALSIFEIGLYNINMRDIFKRLVYMGEWTNNNGGVSKLTFGPLVVYVISSATDMSTVLTRCLEKMFIYDMIKPYVGGEIVAASVPAWKRNRRLLDAAFKPHVLEGYINLFNQQAERLTQTMANHVDTEMDFTQIITRNILETVSQTTMCMNIDGEDLITDSYSRAVEKVMQTITDRFRYPWNILDFVFNNFSVLKKEQDEALKIIWSLSDQMVKQKKAEILNKNDNKADYQNRGAKFQSCLEILLENTTNENNDNNTLTDLQLRQIIDNVMLAGFDTTAPTVLLALVCTGSYPNVQEKVYNEIINELGKEARPILKEDLPKLPYLEAVIKETLRLYPSGTVVARTTTSEVQLENYTIPAGCHVMGHIWALNRNKEYWGPDANEFRPERWLDDVPSHPAAFATFSPGRRNCIGKSYGMTLMKITLAHVIRKFHITADDKKLELEFVILLKSAAGHSIKLKLRKDHHS